MSKYIKLDDVKAKIREEWVKYMPTEMDMSVAFVLGKLSDLPIIEVSDSADRPFEYFKGYEDGKASVEVSEDCISREHLKSFGYINKGDFNSVETIREWIDNAPSVIPKPKEGEWIIDEPEEIGYGTIYECPYCKYEVEFVPTNYCPNCGSRMKGEE